MKSAVVYGPDGAITGVRHAWTFDDMYSAFATQGLESKKKGEFTREELKPLAKVNVESLKEYDFFTYAKAERQEVAFAEPVDYSLEFNPKDTVLTLHFMLPLQDAAEGARRSISRCSIRAISSTSPWPRRMPVSLEKAPAGCQIGARPSRRK